MRWQRNAHRKSRPEHLGHPNPTQHTAESYRERFRSQRLTYLYRLRRMQRNKIFSEKLQRVK